MAGVSKSPPPTKIVATDPADEVLATGSVTLDTGASGSITSVTVNAVTITSGSVPFNTSLTQTATDLAANIQANTSAPDYDAVAVGTTVTITAKPGTGAGPNGFVVISTTVTITSTDVNMAGGTDAAEISETVPALKIWEILTVAITLITDSNAASRTTDLVVEDGSGNEIYRQAITSAILASQTAKIFASKWGGAQPADTTLVHYLTLPDDLELPPGYILKTVTTNLQPGDNYSAPVVIIREFNLSVN